MPPEAVGYVGQRAVGGYAIHSLVGSLAVKSAKCLNVGSKFYIVEAAAVNPVGQLLPSAIPRHPEPMHSRNVPRQPLHLGRVGIATHQAHASYPRAIAAEQPSESLLVERIADVALQETAVAAAAPDGAIGYVDGKRHLVGHFLEHYVVISIL